MKIAFIKQCLRVMQNGFTTVLVVCGVLTTLVSAPALAQGSLEKIKVHGAALVGNLDGDSPERDVYVYLPPSYKSASTKRYPVIYFLHGYGVGADAYVERVLHLPGAVDGAIAAGAKEVIIVMPDAFTKFGGSFFGNAPTIGDWETFVARDLVSYIDKNYRTLATRESRGINGHSQGGYGTVRVGMQHPEVFGAMYAMSVCCVLNEVPTAQAVAERVSKIGEKDGLNNSIQAKAVAWSPNPQKPPYYFDWPYANGEEQPQVQARWNANLLLNTVDQHVTALKQYKAIMIDVGDQDGLMPANQQLEVELTRMGVAHRFEIYEGTHGNRIGQRFLDKVLPFFAENLVSP